MTEINKKSKIIKSILIKSFFTVFFYLLLCTFLIKEAYSAEKQNDNAKVYDLSRSKVMDRAILAVMEDYYDSSRMNSVKMFKGAMDGIVRNVAEVIVDYPDEDVSIIRVLDNKLTIDAKHIKSPWGLSKSFRKIFKFLVLNLPEKLGTDFMKIEYAAVNGLLATLDPHTSAMTPDVWEELRMSTRGEFEGIGIRITTDYREPCNGELTVVDVFEGTPAFKAGLKTGDKIIRIDGDSTVNITTSEAADQLRGTPGTTVNVQIRRPDGTTGTMDIIRQRIPIKSVNFKMLADKVGYIELEAFQQGSVDEMKQALNDLHEQEMKGLIIDLRSNPGGLLDAAIEIADLFIEGGTIVATAGRRKSDREVSSATFSGTQPLYPMLILIDSYTASAGEILSGALRNHGRALLLGERTFGKGSVQSIMPLPDNGAMRMTIQQYLLPGDISIQAVGVPSDIMFHPVVIDKDELKISSSEVLFSEASLDSHLSRATMTERKDRPGAMTLQYFVSAKQRKDDLEKRRRCYLPQSDKEFSRTRYMIEFARKLVAQTDGVTAAELALTAKNMIHEKSLNEKSLVERELKKMGISWSVPEGVQEAHYEEMIPSKDLNASIKIKGKGLPGSKVEIEITVENKGKEPVYRLRGLTQSDNPWFSGLDLVLGTIMPGKKKTWKRNVDLPPIQQTRTDSVEVDFFSYDGQVPSSVSAQVTILQRKEPSLVLDWYLEDQGNGNGILEPGEIFVMHLKVMNQGEGRTFKAEAQASKESGIDIESGRFVLPPLAPGQSSEGRFVFRLPDEVIKQQVKINVSFDEWIPLKMPALINLENHSFVFNVAREKVKTKSVSKILHFGNTETPIYDSPFKGSEIIAFAKKGSAYKTEFIYNDYYKISLDKGRYGFVPSNSGIPGDKIVSSHKFVYSTLPTIEIDDSLSLKVEKEKISITGKAHHPLGISDLFVWVGDKKVEYLSSENRENTLPFNIEIPIEIGMNRISIVARHNSDTTYTENVFVRRID